MARSPLRVGLIGGGSDIPEYFNSRPSGGAVLGLSISLSVYVNVLGLASTSPERVRFTYRQTESVEGPSEIHHPVVRAVLEDRVPEGGINIATMADVPGGTGLGSSSAFTVGLIAAIDAWQGRLRGATDLAYEAVRVERDVLSEAGGWQDQFQSAIGGFRLYNFSTRGVSVEPALADHTADALAGWLLLVGTGKTRDSHEHQLQLSSRLQHQARESQFQIRDSLDSMVRLARDTYEHLTGVGSAIQAISVLAEAVSEGWELKRKTGVEDGGADEVLSRAKKAGALAGKMCGAGGGGYLFLIAPPSCHAEIAAALPEFSLLPVSPEPEGVRVVSI